MGQGSVSIPAPWGPSTSSGRRALRRVLHQAPLVYHARLTTPGTNIKLYNKVRARGKRAVEGRGRRLLRLKLCPLSVAITSAVMGFGKTVSK